MSLRSSSRTSSVRSRLLAEDPAFTAASAAFQRADYDACRSLLELSKPESPSGIARRDLLVARLARIRGDVDVWYAAASNAARYEGSPGDRLTALALRALAARRLGKAPEADRLMSDVYAAVIAAGSAGDPHPAYLCALDAWEERDFDRAERLARANLRRHPGDAANLSLLGWVAVKKERYREAGTYFMRALARLRALGEFELRSYARFVHAASVVACETADVPMGRKVRRAFEALAWPQSLRVERFNTLTNLRLLALIEGNLEAAWLAARDAVSCAPNNAYAAIGETNAAVVTRLCGDEYTAALQMARAWEILRKVRWSESDAEERVALTNFACEAARTMPVEARKALVLYVSLSGKANRANSLEKDRRIAASESWAAGRVAAAMGEREASVLHYGRALAVWQELGFTTRAAAVALDLYRITRRSALKAPIAALTALAPNAWVTRSARTSDGPLGLLRPAQRKVLAGILRGDSAKVIAADLDRSPYTVVNHTRRIFAAFGVRRRADLRALCLKNGITSESLLADS